MAGNIPFLNEHWLSMTLQGHQPYNIGFIDDNYKCKCYPARKNVNNTSFSSCAIFSIWNLLYVLALDFLRHNHCVLRMGSFLMWTASLPSISWSGRSEKAAYSYKNAYLFSRMA